MLFGLVNAPATFQAIMNKILREFLDHGVVVYLDDILIYLENYEENVELVKKVRAKLEEHQLAISLKRSVFHVPSVEFLNYIVAVDGVTMREREVESIKKVEITTVCKGSTDFYWLREFLPKIH